MKVAFVTSYLSRAGGGVSAAVEALSRHLLSTDIDVHVIGLHDPQWHCDAADWNGAPVSALSVRGPSAVGYAPSALSRLCDINASIVHTHGIWTYPSRAVSLWSSQTRRPYVVSPHGMLDAWAIRHSRWKKEIAARLYENAHLHGASCLHALCEAEAQAIRSVGFTNHICVIPNGVTLPKITDDRGIAPWHGLIPASAYVMLFLGRLHPKKNLTALIDAWPHDSEAKNWHLAIAGWDQGGYQQTLECAIRERKLSNRIHLIGPLFGREKERAMRHAHAFVSPSLSEGLPMAVLEAWSYELPVLKTDACNLPEGFEASAATRLSLEPRDMAHDLGNFLNKDPTELRQMGRNGRRLVENKFGWNNVARALLAVYDWLVNGAERPPTIRML
ncbi:MAG TPA: glycosyltransferase [Hyphomicrobium sp.]|jgi:poly(glycerol-phosphate) alpha-glucosyltransferase|nr:glycosyltransferase [Hyphomicrobium sp.]